jgi:glutathione S-transferase
VYPLVTPRPDAAAAAAAAAAFHARLRQLDGMLLAAAAGGGGGSARGSRGDGRYAVGNALTLADCGYPACLHYAELIFPAVSAGEVDYSATPAVAAWRAALLADPAVRAVLDELRPAAQEWLDGKLMRG